ncbi:MAG: two-component sensor kinase [Candidatus Scalindua rubra]|uniref:histidine kinase n=1 Tax=Candidatus Scalindua rubra TaxID=1872076 RepID=A0A1E3X597_9BACT|nr:MAG: two-component sensor kinase [Candidatus Scalindua rubra]
MSKIRDKILVIFLSIVLIPLIIVCTFFALHTSKSLKSDKIIDFQRTTKSESEKAIEFLFSIEKDIRSLSSHLFLLNLIDAIARKDTGQINRWEFDVEILFKTFSECRGVYDQIRYIDESGHEVVRVNLERGYAHIAPHEELQDKSHRYYFKEAVKLNEGDIYVSQLDLNREHGEIEVPHKPMLRYAIPVFDREDKNRGIFVLNVLADFLLRGILTHKHLKGVDSFLLDKEGFYLLHPEISKQWGGPSDLNTGENLKNDFPQGIVSVILSGQSGDRFANKQFLNFIPIHFDPSDNERYWIFIETLPKSIVYSPIHTFYIMFGVLVFMLIAGVVTSALVFSNKLTRPIHKLVASANKIAKGNLTEKVTVESKDEIGYLANSFDTMRVELGKLLKDIKDARRDWETTFDSVGDIIAIYDKDCTLIRSNKALLNRLSVKSEEIIGKKCYEVFHHDKYEELSKCPVIETAKSMKTVTREEETPCMNGIFRISVFPCFNDSGEFLGVVQVMMDITERKREEGKLSMVNKELEAFCYSVSHDLRAPLLNIDGFSKALVEKFADRLDSQGKDYLKRIGAASRRMSRLIDDLRNLSRITHSAMHGETVNMSAMVQRIAAELHEGQPERQVEFVIAEGITANGDASLLSVVLENLLGNAWKFTRRHPRARIEFGVAKDEGSRVYFVSDNGIGFDMAYAGKLFKAFQRLHDKTEFNGTGIGLATVQRIIHRHGGRIWAEGALEHGATFYFTLT